MKTYRVSREDIAKRIDAFLVEKEKTFSRSRVQKAIRIGKILLNSHNVKPSYRLRNGDVIEIHISKERTSLIPNPNISFSILWEDPDIIVIDKPAGLAVHPATLAGTNTLVNGIIAYYPKVKEVGEDPLRPGVVHRLDKETSGVMIVAKNNNAFGWLKSQFQKRNVEKWYIALVHGYVKNARGSISANIAKHAGKQVTGKAIEKLGLPSRSSLTEYSVREVLRDRKDSYTLLDVKPLTGRTHQIRVALASIGHPVVGDTLYAFKGQKGALGMKRQFLHATRLKFQMQDSKVLEFEAPLPAELNRVLTRLKKM